MARLEEEILRGAHASAKDPAAATALMSKKMGQVKQGFARLVATLANPRESDDTKAQTLANCRDTTLIPRVSKNLGSVSGP
jgi:hypothetical protein